MEQQFDLEVLEAKFQAVRTSEYFPAILGAVAGGITGALMAALISGGKREAQSDSGGTSLADKKTGYLGGFSPRDLMQLATLAVSLSRQMREWRREY
jgi:ApbE superfamily uncharacterized protein (UPF0280 family)